MSSLILRFAGPAQSWGSGGQLFTGIVQTEQTPTRSAVLGLLACCLGAPQDQWPEWIEDTRVWVRVDRPGEIQTDYQTVNGVPAEMVAHFVLAYLAQHHKARVPTIETATGGAYNISRRRFLSDAEFVVAIEHDEHIEELIDAVNAPVFMPYLGRKSFSPTFPFLLGVSDDPARTVLSALPTTSHDDHLEVYPVLLDRNATFTTVTVPVASRREQMLWASSHLSR